MMRLRVLGVMLVAAAAFIITATALPTTDNSYPLIGHQVWQLEEETGHGVVRELEAEGLVDILSHSQPASVFRVAPGQMDQVASALRHAALNHTVHIQDLAAFIQAEAREVHKSRATTNKASPCTSTSCTTPFTDAYMKFQEMEHYLKHVSKHPRVEVRSIGKSVEGRDIWMVVIKPIITGGPHGRIAWSHMRRRHIWIEGGIHAREWISPAVVLNLIQTIITEGPATQAINFYIVPVANPDGYSYTWTNNRLWRKNKATNNGAACLGVDLNRNWDSHWGVGASSNYCSQVYKGPKPFSEPETQALSNEMSRVCTFDAVLAFHSYGQLILYPWGWTTNDAPDTPAMDKEGKFMADGIKKASGSTYTVNNSAAGLYFASGITADWAKDKLKTKYVYTIELRDKGTFGFKLPSNQILSTVQEVWAGLKNLLLALRTEKSP